MYFYSGYDSFIKGQRGLGRMKPSRGWEVGAGRGSAERQFLLPSYFLNLEQSFASLGLESLILSMDGRKAELRPAAVARRNMYSTPNTSMTFSMDK